MRINVFLRLSVLHKERPRRLCRGYHVSGKTDIDVLGNIMS